MTIKIKKWGEKMNSPHPWRRNLLFEIEPVTESTTKTLKNVANEISWRENYWKD